jgi:hypothetical protein
VLLFVGVGVVVLFTDVVGHYGATGWTAAVGWAALVAFTFMLQRRRVRTVFARATAYLSSPEDPAASNNQLQRTRPGLGAIASEPRR